MNGENDSVGRGGKKEKGEVGCLRLGQERRKRNRAGQKLAKLA